MYVIDNIINHTLIYFNKDEYNKIDTHAVLQHQRSNENSLHLLDIIILLGINQ